jgi:hypothetical protein
MDDNCGRVFYWIVMFYDDCIAFTQREPTAID